MKYLAIASILALTAFGAVGTASALPDMSAARESGAAESLASGFNHPTKHVVLNATRRPLYLYGGPIQQLAEQDFGIASQR